MDNSELSSERNAENLGDDSMLSARIAAEIEHDIFNGVFVPGDRLNEAALAVRMKTSRGPIREAMRILAGSGLVTMVRNRGVFVREMSVGEIVEVSEVRALIFGYAAEAATESCTDAQIAELHAVVEQMLEATQKNDCDAYYELNLAFHALINQHMQNSKMLKLYAECVRELHLFRRRDFNESLSMRRSSEEHRGIFEAIRAGEKIQAGILARAHIMAGCQRMIRQIPKL